VKFAAIEGRWADEQPATEVLIAIPDAATESNRFEWKIPVLGSIIGSSSLTAKEVGLKDFPRADRPPVLIPFLAFRIMVGCGLLMLLLAWVGSYVAGEKKLHGRRWLLVPVAWSFPLGFIAVLTGWFTAEVGRQPWTVWGVLRTADALTPHLSGQFAALSLAAYVATYAFIFCCGVFYIYRIVRDGPDASPVVTYWGGHAIAQTFQPGSHLGSEPLAVRAPTAERKTSSSH
ncbi:hypothetical protein BZM27_52165, partial [Paraburkholderia steynii]